ncbi:glycosyltransferase [Methylobacterium sp. J-043]|nr:glycosyltransferase [Methylobacterium sp. J-043]
MLMLFSTKKTNKRNISIVGNSILFDAEYYRLTYGVKRYRNAAKHFCDIGWKMGFNPSQHFNTSYYIKSYKDVASNNVNPLVHYLKHGGKEMRRPSDKFDVQSYCAAHPEAMESGKTPAEHCLATYGNYHWRRDLDVSDASPGAADNFLPYFDKEFYLSHNLDVAQDGIDPFLHYIEFGQYESRDPSPNFDTFYVRKELKKAGKISQNIINEHANIAKLQPAKLCNAEAVLFDINDGQPAVKQRVHNLSLCVHVHCFYPELIAELIPGFNNLPIGSAVVVTVTKQADKEFIQNCLANFKGGYDLHVRVVPNRGRDIAPFLIGSRDIWEKYDIVLHLHTKRSTHVYWGDEWRRYLYDQILGSHQLVDNVISYFEQNNTLGCLYPRNFYRIKEFVDVENNMSRIKNFLESVNCGNGPLVQPDYPAGSMAWYRTKALSGLLKNPRDIDRFEEESGQVDLTFAHALERILTLVTRGSGFEVRNYITQIRKRLVPIEGLPIRESSAEKNSSLWPRDTPKIAQNPPAAVKPINLTFNPEQLDIHWILPAFSQAGAGGHMTIFRMVEFLELFGHNQTIWFQNAAHLADQAETKRRIQSWYRPISDRVRVRFLPDDIRQISADVLIATDCWTAFPAAQVTNVKERFYLVQDFEPMFHPVGELYLLAEMTYKFGFSKLCAGNWLLSLMQARGAWARGWELCADHEVYFPGVFKKELSGTVRIAFYSRQYTPRRAVTLGFAAFELLHKQGFKLHVDLFGEEDLGINYSFPYTQHGILSPDKLSEIYRSCDIGVVFSSTNYSLIPLEMMACGLPVVEVDTESTRAIFKNGEVYFALPSPYSIADAVRTLSSSSTLRLEQRQAGLDFTKKTSWERSARSLEAALKERLHEKGYKSLVPAAITKPMTSTNRTATVFIPTFNAGPEFENVLSVLSSQVCDFEYEILIVDSGSMDGTADLVRKFASSKIRCESIDQSQFQHGKTRNLGFELSDSQYVAYITQDALPKDNYWLSNLIRGFGYGPRIAGVIGRHEAYPHHDQFVHRDIDQMFNLLSLLPNVIDHQVGLPSFMYPGSRDWGMLMRFYSDNNSAMSRSVWNILPYPEVDWGEDQIWAEEVLRLGYQKAYTNDAIVYHSHAFDLRQQYSVSATEGRFWAEHFGLQLHENADAAIFDLDERDRAFALRNGIESQLLQKRLLFNRATVQGRQFGYNQVKPPYWPSAS